MGAGQSDSSTCLCGFNHVSFMSSYAVATSPVSPSLLLLMLIIFWRLAVNDSSPLPHQPSLCCSELLPLPTQGPLLPTCQCPALLGDKARGEAAPGRGILQLQVTSSLTPLVPQGISVSHDLFLGAAHSLHGLGVPVESGPGSLAADIWEMGQAPAVPLLPPPSPGTCENHNGLSIGPTECEPLRGAPAWQQEMVLPDPAGAKGPPPPHPSATSSAHWAAPAAGSGDRNAPIITQPLPLTVD